MPEETKLVADYWRQLDFYDPTKDPVSSVLIIGAGAVGSYTAFGLARLGVKHLTIVDPDMVESHNLPNQFFAEGLGLSSTVFGLSSTVFKVNALERTLHFMIPKADICPVPMRIEAFKETPDFTRYSYSAVISAVDDMDVRKWLFDNMQGIASLFLDARIGALYANVYSIIIQNSDARKYYESSLHSNEEAQPLSCSGQSIVDVSMGVASELVGRYRTYAVNNQLVPIHTFHDYKIGQSYAMKLYKIGGSSYVDTLIHEVPDGQD